MLRVLTFNVLQLPVLSFTPHGWRRVELARQVVERADPDIVVLNEAFNASPAGYLLRRLRSHGYESTAQVGSWSGSWTSTTGRPGGRRGVLRSVIGGGVHVLSRRGLHEQHELVYAAYHRKTADALCNKGCALVRVDGPLWIAATHLQADQDPVPAAETQAVRLRQLAEIRALVAAKVPPGEPVLLAGDLNVEHGIDHVAAGEAVGGCLEPSGAMHAPTFDGTTNRLVGKDFPDYSHVLDYVGHIDAGGNRPVPRIVTETLRDGPAAEASDHYPVLAVVELP